LQRRAQSVSQNNGNSDTRGKETRKRNRRPKRKISRHTSRGFLTPGGAGLSDSSLLRFEFRSCSLFLDLAGRPPGITLFKSLRTYCSHDFRSHPFSCAKKKIKTKHFSRISRPHPGVFSALGIIHRRIRGKKVLGNFIAASVALLRTIGYPVGAGRRTSGVLARNMSGYATNQELTQQPVFPLGIARSFFLACGRLPLAVCDARAIAKRALGSRR
jgi:hypothetical protein